MSAHLEKVCEADEVGAVFKHLGGEKVHVGGQTASVVLHGRELAVDGPGGLSAGG